MKLLDIPGIGVKIANSLEKHSITTPEELLTYYPRTYRTYRATTAREATEGEWVSLVGSVTRPISKHTARVTTQIATFTDKSGRLTLRWFNSPFMTRSVDPDVTYHVSGQLSVFGMTRQIVAPQLTKVEPDFVALDELLPLYTPMGTVKSGVIRNIIRAALKREVSLPERIPASIRKEFSLKDLLSAVRTVHMPDSADDLAGAMHTLGFGELYALQLEAIHNSELNKVTTEPILFDQVVTDTFIRELPYKPTGAQSRVMREILGDLKMPVAMHRLLAGEVGSGKTVVAATAALATHTSGKQTLVMAPTQILAEQLHSAFSKLLGERLSISLVTANQKGDTQANIVIGTQALLQPKHQYGDVGLVVVDEQHRFGVKQREYLAGLRPAPYVLMMTATPIPRSLAMTLFANLDISRLDELPSNRLPIKTFYVTDDKRDDAYTWIKKEITENHNQTFVVAPLIEEAEDSEGNTRKSLKLLESNLRARFPNLTIDIMHGKMKEIEKTEHLQKFREGKTDLLVATSMIEVGIDIPRANIMVIEDADRFGLAQLHQLRGRVGRGNVQGYCLILSKSKSPKARDRLALFVRETSGEKLATFDLKSRGPGELFGENQSGYFSLRFASIYDIDLLNETHAAAKLTLDKKLISP